MAKGRRYAQDEPPPADWTPTQAVSDPVINSPYEEPTRHWSYQDGEPFQVPGRRPAMYWYRSKKLAGGQADIFAEEQRDELPLVNRLRADVRRWRGERLPRCQSSNEGSSGPMAPGGFTSSAVLLSVGGG